MLSPLQYCQTKTYITRKTRTFSLNYLCDFIVVPSSAMMAHLMAEGVRTPVTVIPPGFDWPALHNEAMRPLPLHIHALGCISRQCSAYRSGGDATSRKRT